MLPLGKIKSLFVWTMGQGGTKSVLDGYGTSEPPELVKATAVDREFLTKRVAQLVEARKQLFTEEIK